MILFESTVGGENPVHSDNLHVIGLYPVPAGVCFPYKNKGTGWRPEAALQNTDPTLFFTRETQESYERAQKNQLSLDLLVEIRLMQRQDLRVSRYQSTVRVNYLLSAYGYTNIRFIRIYGHHE